MYGRIVTMVLVSALALTAGATQSLATDQAFIDVDNDGVWSAGDQELAPFIGPDGDGIDVRYAEPGWQPRRDPVGIVLQGKTYFTAEDTQITATGNVVIRGQVQAKGSERWVTLETLGGDIIVEPKARVKGAGDFVMEALFGGDIYVGTGAILQTKGEQSELGFRADGDLYIETGVQMKISGYYPWITLRAFDGVHIRPGVRIQGSSHSQIDLLADENLELVNAYFKSGYIRIQAQASARHPEAKTIHVVDSVIMQTYRNGDFRMWAQPALGTTRYANDPIVIERSIVTTKEDLPLYLPDPEIVQ